MALSKQDVVSKRNLRDEATLKWAEDFVDQALEARYNPDHRFEVKFPRRLERYLFERLKLRYETVGWTVTEGWSGTRNDGEVTLILS